VADDAAPALGFERGPLPVPHGFSPRAGGVSRGPWRELNLGASVGDDVDAVVENRRRVAASFGVGLDRVARLDQVHGAVVHEAGPDTLGLDGDGWISDDPSWLLAVSAADCLPVLMFDRRLGAVAAVHAGWRGASAGIARVAVAALGRRYGSDPADLQVWFGPSIRGACYQVGPEVVAAVTFDRSVPADVAWPDPEVEGRWRVDVPSAVRAQLEAAGVAPDAIDVSATCTHCAADRCFSHRRDRGRTGRHWALIRAAG
jgi:polyphenol oxidase